MSNTIEFVNGGIHGYTGIKVNIASQYEKIEVYSIATYPARILDRYSDTEWVDVRREYNPNDDINTLYRVLGMNDCKIYHIGDISGTLATGYQETSTKGEVWQWVPISHNLIKNPDSMQGSSFAYYQSATVMNPDLPLCVDRYGEESLIRPIMKNSLVWNNFKMVKLPAASGATIASFKITPASAWNDIFVPFGLTDPLYTQVYFSVLWNMTTSDTPPKDTSVGSWNSLSNSDNTTTYWCDFSEKTNVTTGQFYTDIQADIYIDGVFQSSNVFQPQSGVVGNWNPKNGNRSEIFRQYGSLSVAEMQEVVIPVTIPVTAQNIEIRFIRPKNLRGSNVNWYFRAPRAYFDYPGTQGLAQISYTDVNDDYYLDRTKVANNVMQAQYPYTSLGTVLESSHVEIPRFDGKTANKGANWEVDTNFFAKINGYYIALVRNYNLPGKKWNTIFKWFTTLVGTLPKSKYKLDIHTMIPNKINPAPTSNFIVPAIDIPGLTPFTPQWVSFAQPTIGWLPIPKAGVKAYDPYGIIAKQGVQLTGRQKELFSDVSKIDFTQVKEVVFPMADYEIGRCNFVIPRVGRITDEPMYLLSGSFEEDFTSNSLVNVAMSGWKQVYAEPMTWGTTSIRVGIKGRAKAVQLLSLLNEAIYFGIELDDEASDAFGVTLADTFAIDGRITMTEWGTDISDNQAVNILEFDIRRIVRPPYLGGD